MLSKKAYAVCDLRSWSSPYLVEAQLTYEILAARIRDKTAFKFVSNDITQIRSRLHHDIFGSSQRRINCITAIDVGTEMPNVRLCIDRPPSISSATFRQLIHEHFWECTCAVFSPRVEPKLRSKTTIDELFSTTPDISPYDLFDVNNFYNPSAHHRNYELCEYPPDPQ